MLHHPCIVRLYETIQCGSIYYLVTELATGGDLCTYIKKQPSGRLDELTAKSYARQLVDALEHMHYRGIVHRDLKMDNIMLQDSRQLRIKIVDFGLSNVCNNNELLKTHCGSPEYAAPELFIDGKKYGPEVDLWSLGVVFYVMATGRLPFVSPQDGHTPAEERRRKFMIQINRGLTALQEKNLSDMSNEYKDALNRLLTPIAHKRITIQDLSFHPWINKRQKSLTKVISEQVLSSFEYIEILNQVSDAAHLDRCYVQSSVSQKKYGDIGGMYNIRVHERVQKKSLPNFPISQISPSGNAKECQADQIYKMASNKPVDYNESIKHLFPTRNPNPFTTEKQEYSPLPVNSKKIVSGIGKRERCFADHQKEFLRPQRKCAISTPQGNRIVKTHMPSISTIPRPQGNRADLIGPRRSQRLILKQEGSLRLSLKNNTKILEKNDFISASATIGNKVGAFYKSVQNSENSQGSFKNGRMLKTIKKDNNSQG